MLACKHFLQLVSLYHFQTFIATGTNLNLQFFSNGLAEDSKPEDVRPPPDRVDFDREPNRVSCADECVSTVGLARYIATAVEPLLKDTPEIRTLLY